MRPALAALMYSCLGASCICRLLEVSDILSNMPVSSVTSLESDLAAETGTSSIRISWYLRFRDGGFVLCDGAKQD
jgi:hypothetical protein